MTMYVIHITHCIRHAYSLCLRYNKFAHGHNYARVNRMEDPEWKEKWNGSLQNGSLQNGRTDWK